MAEKTTVFFVPPDQLLSGLQGGMGAPDGYEEVVLLPVFEKSVDAQRDLVRERNSELRAIARLAGGPHGPDSPLAAVLELREEVEHYRELRDTEPLVVEKDAVDRLVEAAKEYLRVTEGCSESTETVLQLAIREVEDQ